MSVVMTEAARLTRSEHSLAAHDEDNLHGSKLCHSHRPTCFNSKPKLGAEYDSREGNANKQRDVAPRRKLVDRTPLPHLHVLKTHDAPIDLQDHEDEPQGDGYDCDESRRDVDRVASTRLEHAADDADLHHQGQLNDKRK